MELSKKDHPTLPLLVQSYMKMEEIPFILHLVEEVPYFKAYIRPYIGMSKKQLVGHSNERQYKFFMDDNGWPIMQYKLVCTDILWLPEHGLKLWKEDVDHKSILPQGNPRGMEPKKMKNKVDILCGLDGFIQHWTDISKEDGMTEYKTCMLHLVTYWTSVRNAMCCRVDVTNLPQVCHQLKK